MISKRISSDKFMIRTKLYPSARRNRSGFAHSALLGIGGNVGDTIRRFEHLYILLARSPLVSIVETSPILKNPPFGFMDQDDFYNALIGIKTDLTPLELLRYILKIERRFGRKRSFANAPRTLDIDIIFFDDIIMNKKKLTLPHPRWRQRESVLLPLERMKGIRWSKRHS